LKIIFLGTPQFSVPFLKAINSSHHKIVGVVTNPDRKAGRGRKVTFSPVKKGAIKLELKFFQPQNINQPEFISQLKKLKAEAGVIVAYGRILKREIIDVMEKGWINFHPSLLPKYRGPSPIQWAILNGDSITGITTTFLDEKMDSGDIILQKEIKIKENDTFGKLKRKIKVEGCKLLLKTLDLVEKGDVKTIVQDDRLATYTKKITKNIKTINWNNTSRSIYNQIRALNPIPGAQTILRGKILKIWVSKIINRKSTLPTGSVVTCSPKEGLFIATSDYLIRPLILQPQNRRKMKDIEFLRGYQVKRGDILGIK
jgi:methionyl-tRNA formyltransferase